MPLRSGVMRTYVYVCVGREGWWFLVLLYFKDWQLASPSDRLGTLADESQ